MTKFIIGSVNIVTIRAKYKIMYLKLSTIIAT